MSKPSRYNVAHAYDDGSARLYNTLHLSSADLDAAAAALLATPDELPSDALAILAGLGMVVADDLDELAVVQQRQAEERFGRARLELTIAPSLSCNLRCVYCPEIDKRPETMTAADEAELVRFVAARLDSSPETRELQVTWFGGEPLTHPDVVLRLSHRFLKLCWMRGIAYRATMFTNGSLLNAELAARLAAAFVREIRITLDGPRDLHDLQRPTAGGHGSYDAALRGVEAARGLLDVAIGISVCKPNVRRIPELLDELARRGLHDVPVFFVKIVDYDNSAGGSTPKTGGAMSLSGEHYAAHEVKLLKHGRALGLRVFAAVSDEPVPCAAVRDNHFVVEPKGRMRRCYAELSDDATVTGTMSGGSFQAGPTDSIWQTSRLGDDECEQCPYLPICHGGCPKLRFDGADKHRDICTHRRFNLPELLELSLL